MTVDEIPSTPGEILSDRVLGRELGCTCGRAHRVHTRRVVIEPHVEDLVPQVLAELVPPERVLLVSDRRTWQAAGEATRQALESRYEVRCCTLKDGPDGHVHASVELVDDLAADLDDIFDAYVAVGSGTVNDITKELAHRRRRPYVVVATAASMNGFTSSIVALLDDGLKTTGAATPPLAVFADPLVLAAAPRELTLAGLGDLVSKPYCSCDWAIASLVRGEFHCPLPDRLLSAPFERALPVFPRLADGDPEAVALLFELLLVSGISMAVAGTSSPASGGEHLLSHFWDMMRLRDRCPLELHGAQVGVASMVVDQLYREVVGCDFCAAESAAQPSLETAEREVREVFGELAEAVWPQWRAKLEVSSERDLERLCAHQVAIRDRIAATLDQGARVRHALQAAGAPVRASQLGISRQELASAVRHGRKIRTRFTVLDVAAGLGILDGFADRMSAEG